MLPVYHPRFWIYWICSKGDYIYPFYQRLVIYWYIFVFMVGTDKYGHLRTNIDIYTLLT